VGQLPDVNENGDTNTTVADLEERLETFQSTVVSIVDSLHTQINHLHERTVLLTNYSPNSYMQTKITGLRPIEGARYGFVGANVYMLNHNLVYQAVEAATNSDNNVEPAPIVPDYNAQLVFLESKVKELGKKINDSFPQSPIKIQVQGGIDELALQIIGASMPNSTLNEIFPKEETLKEQEREKQKEKQKK
jgi:hypothetical protein